MLVFAAIQNLEEKLPEEFVVKVNDTLCGMVYLRQLLDTIDEYKKIKKGKLINGGDALFFVKNDVYVEDSKFEILTTSLPKFDLVSDYNKVDKTVKNFFNKVYKPAKKEVKRDLMDLIAEILESRIPSSKIIRDGQWVNVEEKVTIFNNFVKIGYDQYDIRYDYFGNEYVNIDGNSFEIKSDYKGLYLKLA